MNHKLKQTWDSGIKVAASWLVIPFPKVSMQTKQKKEIYVSLKDVIYNCIHSPGMNNRLRIYFVT